MRLNSPVLLLIALSCCLSLVAWAIAQTNIEPGLDSLPRTGQTANVQGQQSINPDQFRIREGTKLENELGYFRVAGNRIMFSKLDGSTQLIGLENLTLERISQIIGNNPAQMQWDVTGVVTEYRGDNYLLINRAVLTTEKD